MGTIWVDLLGSATRYYGKTYRTRVIESGDGDSVKYRLPAERLKEIKAPTLVLWTDKNPGAGADVGKHISSLIPGSSFYCIVDAAHWPQWEHPEEHDEIVLRFLSDDKIG